MQSFGHPFNILASVDSTNNYAMQMIHARMTKHGAAWFTWEQTRGKGQRGKTWLSNPGENIAISIVIEPENLSPANPFLLAAAVALGSFDFVKKYLGEEVTIKWPNDIYWRDRKAGGILIESVIRGAVWKYTVADMGFNVNQPSFNPGITRAVSFKMVTGQTYDVISLAKELCIAVEQRYEQLTCGLTNLLLEDYNSNLYRKNAQVVLRNGNEELSVVVKCVTEQGRLNVLLNTGEERLYNWGEVEWILPEL